MTIHKRYFTITRFAAWTMGMSLALPSFASDISPSLQAEYEKIVNDGFCRALERPADEAGLANYVQNLAEGMTVKDMMQILVLSDEHAKYFYQGKSNQEFVENLYDHILAREADQAGLDNWVAFLEQGGTPEQLINTIFDEQTGQEYNSSFGDNTVPGGGRENCGIADPATIAKYEEDIDKSFCRFLERHADESGLNTYSYLFDVGRIERLKELHHILLLSDEYKSRFYDGKTSEEVVTYLYDHILARTPEPEGLARWSDVLEQGWTLEQVVDGMLNDSVNSEYDTNFGDNNLVPGDGREGCGEVTLTITQPENGKVTGDNLDCGTTCSADYAIDNIVTLTATSDEGYQFVDWTGDCSGSMGTIDVVMDQAKTCTANFEPTTTPDNSFNLSKNGIGISRVKPAGETAWTIDCRTGCSEASHNFALGTELLLTASPKTGFEFTGWQCDNGLSSDKARWSFTLDKPTICTVTLSSIEDDPNFYKLTVKTIGTGLGYITAGGANLGEEGVMNFKIDSTTRLIAEPSSPLHTFKGWSGDCSGIKPTLKLKMDSDKTCYAEFESVVTQVSQGMVEQLYQDDVFASQYPQAENSECLEEAMSFAIIPMQFIDSHLQTKASWPAQFNDIEWYTPPPVTQNCTQSVKLIGSGQGNYLQVQAHLSNATGQTELVNLQTFPPNGNNNTLADWTWIW